MEEAAFLKDINDLLKENMSVPGYALWEEISSKTTMVMHRPSSGSGKYHNNDDGGVYTIGEHTYQILYTTIRAMKLFDTKPKSKHADILLLAAACHDLLKYGNEDPLFRKTTDKRHDKLIADTLLFNKTRILETFNVYEFNKLEQICRYHTGRWSTDATETFDFSKLCPEVMFVHILDMLSSQNLLKVPVKK
jgi:hypothetical protein